MASLPFIPWTTITILARYWKPVYWYWIWPTLVPVEVQIRVPGTLKSMAELEAELTKAFLAVDPTISGSGIELREHNPSGTASDRREKIHSVAELRDCGVYTVAFSPKF